MEDECVRTRVPTWLGVSEWWWHLENRIYRRAGLREWQDGEIPLRPLDFKGESDHSGIELSGRIKGARGL